MLPSRRELYTIFGALAASLIIFGLLGGFVVYLRQPVKTVYSLSNVKVGSPLKVSFSRPVQDHLNYNISPGLAGQWQVSRNLFGVTAVTFIPTQPLVPGSNYQVIVGHVVGSISSQPSIAKQAIPVSVQRPAAIASITPATAAINVPTTSSVVVKLAASSDGLRQLRLEADASLASATPTTSDGITFTWKFAQPLQQGHTYHLTLLDLKQSSQHQGILASTFTTVPEPQITSATNQDHFYPGNTITIGFDQAMKPLTSDFKLGFAGSGHWQDAHTYVFTPTGLVAGQSYSYTVVAGSASTMGGLTESDHTYSISLPGAAYIVASAPSGGNVAVSAGISFTFDQPVNPASAQAAFSISPATPGSFSWSDDTLTFHPTSLVYQTGYIATIGAGVQAIYGLPSTRNFSDNFTTTYQVLKLAVPGYYQQYVLSCEESALRMALAYRGINVNDWDVLMRVGYNPEPRNLTTNSWDNPYQMFVGDVNGQQGVTGWGVYGPPIAAAAQSFGRNASYVSGISANQIASAIYNNDPVVVWGFSGSAAEPDSWDTTTGSVEAPRNEHARTIYGVAGSAANPIGFYIHDPFYGDIYWTTAQLQWNMDFGGLQPSQGVIVY